MILITPITTRDRPRALAVAAELVCALPGYQVEDVMDRVDNRLWALWSGVCIDPGLTEECKFVFALEHTRDGLLVPALVGNDRKMWLTTLETWLAAYGRNNGFSKAIMWGRQGWSREAASRGWEQHQTLFSMEL